MTAPVVDRARLAELRAVEERRFAELHPRSAALAAEASGSLLAGVPMPWMTRWPGAFPVFCDSASGARLVDVDGLEYVDLCLGDTGAMTGHALPQVAEAVAADAALITAIPNQIVIAAMIAAKINNQRFTCLFLGSLGRDLARTAMRGDRVHDEAAAERGLVRGHWRP